jgi:acyl-lipid omega-6 desaturase (Delta-12 desaturase)
MTMMQNLDTVAEATAPKISEWKEIVSRFQEPSAGRAIWQLVNTLVPYAALWYAMYRAVAVSWWLALPLMAVAGLLLVRVFIIFHDCGHGSFFRSKRVNDLVGFFTGMLTFTPYHHWRWEHSLHHASSGDLDRRGVGDIWTLTVNEYLAAPFWKRLAYRVTRNPFVLFVLAPIGLFLIYQRRPSSTASARERNSVWMMNLALVVMGVLMSWAIGFKTYALLQLGVMTVAGSAGVWMFYVQHQFEDVYWERREEWDYTAAALQGSSFYKLPKILQWFTGNIGFHHVHHLSSRIPNYNLPPGQAHHAAQQPEDHEPPPVGRGKPPARRLPASAKRSPLGRRGAAKQPRRRFGLNSRLPFRSMGALPTGRRHESNRLARP